MAENLKQKTVKGVSWSFVEQVLTRGINFIIGIILARLLSPTDYGLVGMLAIFIAISQLFIDGGLSNALIRQKNASEADFSTVFFINLTLSILFYFLLFFTAPLVADFYSQPLLKPLMRVVSLPLVIGAIASVPGTLLTIRVDFKSKTLISLITSIVSGAAGILFAIKGAGVWALAAQSISAAIASTLITIILVRWWPKRGFVKESFQRLFSFSSKILTASLISTVYENAYPMVIGKKFSAKDVGLFSRAGQFPGIANTTLATSFNRVAYPVLSQIQDDDDHLLRVYEKYIQIYCFIAFPILMGLCGCAKPIILFLLTDKWIECVPFMQIICFSLIPNGMILINLNLLYVKGRSDLVLRMEIIKKTIMFAVLFISTFWGLRAICYAMIINALIDLYFSSFYTKRILGYRLIQQIKAVYPYFLISLIILAEAWLSSSFIPNNLVSLLVSLAICPITYWAITKFTKVYAYTEAITLLQSKLHKK